MAEIEDAAAAAIAASIDDDAPARAPAGTVPFGSGAGTGPMNSSSSTTPLGGQGLNAGSGTRPMEGNWAVATDDEKFAEAQAQTRIDRARADASFREFCKSPGDPARGPIAGLEFIQPKGQNNE